jgi:hypothetical protein
LRARNECRREAARKRQPDNPEVFLGMAVLALYVYDHFSGEAVLAE